MSGFGTTPFGFHIMLENGWTVSVQFGTGNYCANRDLTGRVNPFTDTPAINNSVNAEIAAWPTEERRAGLSSNGDWYQFEEGDTVRGWQSPSQVLEFINLIAKLEGVTTNV
jgi:hypothetical protein